MWEPGRHCWLACKWPRAGLYRAIIDILDQVSNRQSGPREWPAQKIARRETCVRTDATRSRRRTAPCAVAFDAPNGPGLPRASPCRVVHVSPPRRSVVGIYVTHKVNIPVRTVLADDYADCENRPSIGESCILGPVYRLEISRISGLAL